MASEHVEGRGDAVLAVQVLRNYQSLSGLA